MRKKSGSLKASIDWLPPALAAIALLASAVVLAVEVSGFKRAVIGWANRDLAARAELASRSLVDAIRTQDFRAIGEFGAQCRDDGVRLTILGPSGGRVFDTAARGAPDGGFRQWNVCPDGSRVGIGVSRERVLLPFRRALSGFALAGIVGMAAVFLFFFTTYRQRLRIDALARAERFRRDFVADLSHEIKTPLTGILGATDLLGDDPEPQVRQRLIVMIRDQSRRLNSLAQSVLDLARLENDGVAINIAPVDLADIIQETISRFSTEAAAANVRLISAVNDPVIVACDAVLVGQAIANLVANALRHAQANEIAVSVGRSQNCVTIVVSDDGIGVPREHAAKIFERFHRVDPARCASTGGAGLGLAIVRRIARLHGGDATCEPNSPRGSRFTISFNA